MSIWESSLLPYKSPKHYLFERIQRQKLIFNTLPERKEKMFSQFTKSNDPLDLTCRPKIKNRDLPLRLQQPPLLQRLKKTTFKFLKLFIIIGIFLFVVIMAFGDGTRAKKALTWCLHEVSSLSVDGNSRHS